MTTPMDGSLPALGSIDGTGMPGATVTLSGGVAGTGMVALDGHWTVPLDRPGGLRQSHGHCQAFIPGHRGQPFNHPKLHSHPSSPGGNNDSGRAALNQDHSFDDLRKRRRGRRGDGIDRWGAGRCHAGRWRSRRRGPGRGARADAAGPRGRRTLEPAVPGGPGRRPAYAHGHPIGRRRCFRPVCRDVYHRPGGSPPGGRTSGHSASGGRHQRGSGQLANTGAGALQPAAGLAAGALALGAALLLLGRRRVRS